MTRTVTVDMPTLIGKYFTVTVRVKRQRRVSLGLWLVKLGARLAGLSLEVEEVKNP